VGHTFVAISGTSLVYMVDGSKDAAVPRCKGIGMADFIAYRRAVAVNAIYCLLLSTVTLSVLPRRSDHTR